MSPLPSARRPSSIVAALSRTGACVAALLCVPVVAAADDSAAIEDLRQQLRSLQQRVEQLEAGMQTQQAAVEAVQPLRPVAGGWRQAQNWRLLEKGQEGHVVEGFLGEPDNTRRVAKFEYWEYGDGLLRFYLGRLKSWELPAGLEHGG